MTLQNSSISNSIKINFNEPCSYLFLLNIYRTFAERRRVDALNNIFQRFDKNGKGNYDLYGKTNVWYEKGRALFLFRFY